MRSAPAYFFLQMGNINKTEWLACGPQLFCRSTPKLWLRVFLEKIGDWRAFHDIQAPK
jgi:hypothetical protein